MADKHVTLTQMKKLALREKSNALALAIKAIEASLGAALTITLPVANWDRKVQTVQNPFFLADGDFRYIVGADADNLSDYSNAGIEADNITVNGEITFRCEVEPDDDLTVNIIRLEVTNEQQP